MSFDARWCDTEFTQAPRPERVVQAVRNDDLGNAGGQTERRSASASLMNHHGHFAKKPVVIDERHFADALAVAESEQRAAGSADHDGAGLQTDECLENDRSKLRGIIVRHAA